MSLRVLKAISGNDDTVTALYWGASGLCSGTINGDVFIWPTDVSLNSGLCHLSDQTLFKAHSMAVTSIACISEKIISISLDGTIFVSDISKNTVDQVLKEIKDPFCVTADEKKGFFYIGTLDGSVYSVDSNTMSVKKGEKLHSSEVVSISVHSETSNGCAMSNKELILFDLESLEIKKRLVISADCCNCVTFSDDGLSLLVTTTEGTVRVVDTVSFKEVGCQPFEIGELNDIAPIDHGKRYVVAGSEGKVGIFNLTKMIKEKGLKATSGLVKCVAVQQEYVKIAVGGNDSMINILDFD